MHAIIRFNLFDVNRVISVTIMYSIAIGILSIGVLSGVNTVSTAAALSLDLPSWALQGLLLIFLFSVAALSHRNLLSRLERLLFPERAELVTKTNQAMKFLRLTRSPMSAIQVFVETLKDGLAPATLAIYSRSDAIWVNVYAYGPAIAAVIPENGALVQHIKRAGELINLEAGASDVLHLQGSDAAFALSMDLSLVLPVFIGEELHSLVCVGPKQSSDVYVSSELVLLSALLSVVAEKLSHFEHSAVLKDTRRAAESLRRYVPGAVAQGILEGRSLETGECPVTLMFVDMRGYSSYAEARPVTQVFSLLDAHTQRVSAVVSRHGGNVVEFNGDGMMAVFGAPDPLDRKEDCAVAAAREIHLHLATLPTDTPARVGVGIATGKAYVGSVRAVDRWIWTAVGEATNRAARLQVMTRELDAETVIDESTWRALDRERSGFVPLYRQKLRGLARRQDLFVRPLAESLPALSVASELTAPAAQ